jgi:protein-disulfide isomerase
MNRQRIIIFSLLTIVFVGMTALYFRQVWNESRTRFRTGYDVPRDILPDDLLSDTEIYVGTQPTAPNVRETDPLLAGNSQSLVTMIAFGDFQSDLCRQQATAIKDALRTTAVGDNVRVVWRDLPIIRGHSKALPSAIVGRCAAKQGKFRQMHDLIFEQAVSYDDMEFLRFARKINLDEQDYTVCVRDPAITFSIDRDIEDALRHGVAEVPMLFINGQAFRGFTDAQTLTEILRYELSRAEASNE